VKAYPGDSFLLQGDQNNGQLLPCLLQQHDHMQLSLQYEGQVQDIPAETCPTIP